MKTDALAADATRRAVHSPHTPARLPPTPAPATMTYPACSERDTRQSS